MKKTFLICGSVIKANSSEVVKLKNLKEGEYFCLKSLGGKEAKESQIWVKGTYDKSTRKYSCTKFEDISHEKEFSGDKIVFTDFIF